MFARYQNTTLFECSTFLRQQDVKRWRTWRGQGSYKENVSCSDRLLINAMRNAILIEYKI